MGRWQEQLTLWREALNISPNYNLFDRFEMRVRGLNPTNRITGILNLVVAEKSKHIRKKTKATIQKALSDTIVDISQNPCRRSYSTSDGIAHTICTSSSLVHLGLGRMLHPKELLWMQGHNPKSTLFPEGMALTDIKKLAGEGMALPCVAVCIWSQYLVKAFPDPWIQVRCEGSRSTIPSLWEQSGPSTILTTLVYNELRD